MNRPGLALVVLCVACAAEQPGKSEGGSRSEAISVVLPENPADLAALLGTSPDSLLSAGQERYQNQVYDSARAIWNVELTRSIATQDRKAEARARMWLGMVAWRLGDYRTARREGEESIKIKRAQGMDDELSRSFNSLGLIAWNEGRHADALVYYDSAVAAAKRNGDAAGIARASANIPLVKVELGRFDEARRDFEHALEANRAASDDRTQGNILANLGMLEIRLGNPQKGIEWLNAAREQYADREIAGQANALGQLATAWMALGELQRGIATVDSAITLAKSEGLQQELAANLEVLAELEMRAGNYRIALASLHAADSIDEELGLSVEKGMNLRRSSMILFELEEIEPALQMSARAVAEHRKTGAMNEVVLDRLLLSTILTRTGRKRDALAQLDSAESEAKATNNPATITEALLESSRAALGVGAPRDALAKLASIPSSTSADWRIAELRAASLLAMKRYADARKSAREAVDLVERERASLGVGPLRSGYLASRTEPFSLLVSIDLALHDTAAAFEVAASLPGRSLAERLSGVEGRNVRLASIARNEKLLVRAAELERQVAEARSSDVGREQIEALETELSRTRTEYETALAKTARIPGAAMLGAGKVTSKEIESRLGPRDALLLYLSGGERLDIFVVRSNRVMHRSVSVADRELARRVRVARDAVQRSRDAVQPLAALYDVLIGPVNNELAGVSNLFVVPHGPLSALPFAALWRRGTGQFLIEEKSITYAPAVAAVGYVSSPVSSRRISVFAPEPGKLPASEKEAAAISRLGKSVRAFVGRRSTKQGVRQALELGDIVHIAAHGSHNSQNPLFSRLAVDGRSNLSSSGRSLAVHEILGLSTHSPLVFLSGCETGVRTAGQGVFSSESEGASLSQAFLFAGASSVVATLWPVSDSEAGAIAADFYQRMQAGRRASEALAESQRRAIGRQRTMTWAAYTVSSAGGANSN
jgi:CHAT domain-containing protein/tetratricopeptide (TPR) repeat protein